MNSLDLDVDSPVMVEGFANPDTRFPETFREAVTLITKLATIMNIGIAIAFIDRNAKMPYPAGMTSNIHTEDIAPLFRAMERGIEQAKGAHR